MRTSTAVAILKGRMAQGFTSAIWEVLAAVLAGAIQAPMAHAAVAGNALEAAELKQLKSDSIIHLAQSNSSQTIDFDIKAQPMSEALTALGAQSGLTIIVETKVSKGINAAALSGQYTPNEALKKLLEPAGLKAEYLDSKTVAVRAAKDTARLTRADDSNLRLAQNESQSDVSQSDVSQSGSSSDALVSGSSPSSTGTGFEGSVDCSLKENKDHSSCEITEIGLKAIPEVLVSGSRVLNMDIRRTENDIQPYVIFNRETIESSGATNLEDFFRNHLTMSTGSTTTDQDASYVNRSNINLRGLGSDETLILVDGRRMAQFSGNSAVGQPDISGIPLGAIERIEVLPTTASGIYGGGATGGVINIILRRGYSGVDTTLTYGNAIESDVSERRIDVNAGFNIEDGRTTVLLAGSYSDANPLLNGERDLTARGRNHILQNNPAAFYAAPSPPLGATPNIRGIDPNTLLPVDLTLDNGTALNFPITFIPSGYAGTQSDGGAALVGNAGQYNFDLADTAQPFGARRALLSTPRTRSLMAMVRREFSSSADAFVDLQMTDRSTASAYNGASLSGAESGIIIPADAPNNPFQQSIQITLPGIGLDSYDESEAESLRAVAGIIVRLPAEWQTTLDFSWNRSRYEFSQPAGITTAMLDAINDGSLDVMRDLERFPVSWEREPFPTYSSTPSDAVLKSVNWRIAGPLPWALPGGDIVLSGSIEHREESISDYVLTTNDLLFGSSRFLVPNRSQVSDGVYLESKVPLVSKDNRVPGVESLELQVAARADRYRVRGATGSISLDFPTPIVRTKNELSSVDPTFGLRYQPFPALALRASYGTGYLPPSVTQLVPLGERPLPLSSLQDPLRNNEQLGVVTVRRGGNPDLRPESSKSWSAGAIFSWNKGFDLRFSADWTRIEKTDNIGSLNITSQSGLIDAIVFFPERITRGPASEGFDVGRITFLDGTVVNVAQLAMDAADVALDLQFATGGASNLEFSLAGTRMISLETRLTPSSVIQERVGTLDALVSSNGAGGLRWKANATAKWTSHGWSLGWRTRFFDSYFLNITHTIDTNQGAATVPSQIYHDIFGNYQFGRGSDVTHPMLESVDIGFGINNVFNKMPPLDVALSPAYYSTLGDPRLLTYYITVRKALGQ